MTHRIVVIGAGYAGLPAATGLGRRLRGTDTEVTLVNAAPSFVERPRLHQSATGQRMRPMPLRRFLDPWGVRLVVGTVDALDIAAMKILLDDGQVLPYDTLVHAAGSTVDTAAVPGVAEHAHVFRDPAATLDVQVGGRYLVCGGGLSGIEAATELAERCPSLAVTLLSPELPGHWLSARARRHLARAFDRLGVEVRTGARVAEVRAGVAVLDDGTTLGFDGCVWAGGFTVPALARDAGLAVDAAGRVVVDATQRSVSHPDVYAIGDAAAARGPDDRPLAMGCRTGGFTGPHAANVIADRLAGRAPRPFRFRYVHECISLGRGDAVIQFLHADGRTRPAVLTGRAASAYKEVVLRSAGWLFRFPLL